MKRKCWGKYQWILSEAIQSQRNGYEMQDCGEVSSSLCGIELSIHRTDSVSLSPYGIKHIGIGRHLCYESATITSVLSLMFVEKQRCSR